MKDNVAIHPPKARRILHVDINAYFATLLQQENPFLRGKPVGVLKGEKRSCVITSSKEAKALGVKTGCGMNDAKRLAPGIIFVPANFMMCLDATKRLKRLFETIAPNVDIFSLDEAFIDLTDCGQLYPDARKVADKIQENIKKELGEWVTCNIGISHSKLLAKMASEMSPKGSITEITTENMDAMLATASFADVCGIGYNLQEKLEAIGVTNPYMINFISDEDLDRQFGPLWAGELRRIARGEDSFGLAREDTNPHMKSVGRSITGYKLCDDEITIKRVLYNLTDEVTYKVRKMDLAGRYVGIGLYGRDERWHAHRTLQYTIRHTKEMFDILYGEMYNTWKRNFKVVKYSVYLGMLKPNANAQVSLFGARERWDQVYGAIDSLSDRYGLFTVRSGLLANVPIIRPEVTGWLGDKKFQFGSW